MSFRFATISSIASTIRRNTTTTSRPSHPKSKDSVKRRKLAKNSLVASLRYAGLRTLSKLHLLMRGEKHAKHGFPTSTSETFALPCIFVTTAEKPEPSFTPVRRHCHIRSPTGITSVREAARQRRSIPDPFISTSPASAAASNSSSDHIDFAEFTRQVMSPEYARAFSEIDKIFYAQLQAGEIDIELVPLLLPEDCSDLGSDREASPDLDEPATPELMMLSDRIIEELKAVASNAGIMLGEGGMDVDAEFQRWLADGEAYYKQEAWDD
ncbi:hypothetical protein FA95DRAFT_1606901 [Auriscalpium vulgare]|uniref:Uncharacterized protein n=1 Tax=Auriscalpium vulgare TaxID=40419 RepID=A0ACB8RQC8_9AGAM|nr:hypothetical protein FA95DRAFT_1606901 [Auriscalpium vulgare]